MTTEIKKTILNAMFSFKFHPLQAKDFKILHSWLNRPHIIDIWSGDQPIDYDQVVEKYQKHLLSNSVFPYIVEFNERPIGYIQAYNCELVGEGWWETEPQGTWGMDQFIGEESLLNKGIGSAFIRDFSNQLLQRESVNRIIVDPNPTNSRAIRSYEKAGFTRLGLTTTPDGPALILEKCIQTT